MNIEKTYQSLVQLDPEEAIAYEYYIKYGETLDVFETKIALSNNPDRTKAADFSCLSSIQPEAKAQILTEMKAKNKDHKDMVMLTEDTFILEGYNVELNNSQRYIRLFPHSHDFFELECTLAGKCGHTVENRTIAMRPGDVVIVPPGVCHNVYAYPGSITINIKIRESTFDQTFLNLLHNNTLLSDYFAKILYHAPYKSSFVFHCGQEPFLFDLLLYMYTQQQEAKPYSSKVIENMMATFFSYLIQNYEKQAEILDNGVITDKRMIETEQYLRQNYRTATLHDTAKHFYLSAPYLSAYIKKNTGMTFSQLLQDIRMQNACRLLQDQTLKIDQVGEMAGYRDVTQFIRTFKKCYAMTPKQYQKSKQA